MISSKKITVPLILLMLSVIVGNASASSWTLANYSTVNYLNVNKSTTIDWWMLNCYNGQSPYVTVTVQWGDGSQSQATGANSQGYLLNTPYGFPSHTYSLSYPIQYMGTVNCYATDGSSSTTFTFTVNIYNGYNGEGLGGGLRPAQQ